MNDPIYIQLSKDYLNKVRDFHHGPVSERIHLKLERDIARRKLEKYSNLRLISKAR